jgi:exopolysaccharide production protein ExoZ
MIYKNVQVLRAAAASLVVMAHAVCIMYVPSALVTLGTSGVDIFFVISGFIICQVAGRAQNGAAYFLVRRWWRIFPLYWIVLAFSVALSVAFNMNWAPWMPTQHSALDYILLLTTENHFLPQAWSLVFELYFYALLALVLFIAPAGRFYRTLALLMGAQVALVALCGPNGAPPTNALSLEFALGCAVAWLNARNWIRHELIAWGVGLLFFGAGEWWSVYIAPLAPLPRLFTFGVGAALGLYALVGLDRRGVRIFPRVLERLGDASYSLYLWHIPLLTILMTVGIRKLPALALVFLAAFASYYLIEAPLLRLDGPRLLKRLAARAVVPTRSGWTSLSQRLRDRFGGPSSPVAWARPET